MRRLAVAGQAGLPRRKLLATAVTGALVSAAALVPLSAAGSPPTSRACPAAAIVNSALGEKGKTPVATTTAYSKTCTYPGSGPVPTKITFQLDTASQFAADEKAVSTAGLKPITVHGLGQAAWTTNEGSLYVFEQGDQIKILAPLTATSKLETLARKLL